MQVRLTLNVARVLCWLTLACTMFKCCSCTWSIWKYTGICDIWRFSFLWWGIGWFLWVFSEKVVRTENTVSQLVCLYFGGTLSHREIMLFSGYLNICVCFWTLLAFASGFSSTLTQEGLCSLFWSMYIITIYASFM